jgi:ribosomal protein S18 acetylase RimI-like enzyme
MLTVSAQNVRAAELYRRAGFVPTGKESPGGDEIFELRLS